MSSAIIMAIAAISAAPALAGGQRAPMGVQDLVTLPQLGAPAVSGDGHYAVYSVTKTDPETYERSAQLFIRDLTDTAAAPIPLDLGGPAFDASFSADSHLYFMSDRAHTGGAKGAVQIWRVEMDKGAPAGTPTQITGVDADITGYSVSPDGKKILLFGEIARNCLSFGCSDTAPAHLAGPGTGRLYNAGVGFIRHWDQWETPGIYSRGFVFDLIDSQIRGGHLIDGRAPNNGAALDGPAGAGALIGDTPTKPFGGGEDAVWAPDSTGIYFAARKADAIEPRSTNIDIYWSDLSGGAPVNLTQSNTALDTVPAPSPDGQWLAYAAMARPGYEADRLVIQLRNRATGETRAITQDFDRSFHAISWTPDSRWIIASAQDTLDTPAFRIDPRTGKVERLDLMPGNEANISAITALPGNRLLFTRNSIGAPSELFLSEKWRQARPLTNIAATELGKRASVVIRRFSFLGADGDTVWGQITKLEGKDEPKGAKMPAILYVHGGPQGTFNDSWSTRWNPRVVASQGYAVISVDFHGSTGYGQDFTDSVSTDWGGKPLEDLQKGLASALVLDPQIDSARVCAMGASYGGYMMNWIEGNWADRFQCLVQHDGVFDMRAMYYETEEQWFMEWENGGKAYYEDPAEYEKWNPVHKVADWKTPMLVITGEKDFRIPYSQGIASFTALQRLGIPAQLLVFPDENHWVLKPANSVQWHSTVFAWLDKWLKTEGSVN